MSSFWFIIKQQWKLISIFSNSSHLEWRVELSDTILKWDYPRTIPARFGLIWFSGFRGKDLNVICLICIIGIGWKKNFTEKPRIHVKLFLAKKGSFWQQWTIEEISIFRQPSSGLTDTILKGTPREPDQNMPNLHNRYISASKKPVIYVKLLLAM